MNEVKPDAETIDAAALDADIAAAHHELHQATSDERKHSEAKQAATARITAAQKKISLLNGKFAKLHQ